MLTSIYSSHYYNLDNTVQCGGAVGSVVGKCFNIFNIFLRNSEYLVPKESSTQSRVVGIMDRRLIVGQLRSEWANVCV